VTGDSEVNALGWVITTTDGFVTFTETYLSDIENKLGAGPTEERSEEFLLLLKELAEFVSDNRLLIQGHMNPLDLPPAVQENGAPIPNYFVLKTGPWRAFYRLDYVAKVGVGVIVLHDDNKLQDTLAELLQDASRKV